MIRSPKSFFHLKIFIEQLLHAKHYTNLRVFKTELDIIPPLKDFTARETNKLTITIWCDKYRRKMLSDIEGSPNSIRRILDRITSTLNPKCG